MVHTARQKREAVEREIAYRVRVYDRRVAEGRMTKQLADYQLSVFREILADYLAAEAKERLI